MEIQEVIERAQSYCPSEYDMNEMSLWCDEVSAMISTEVLDRQSYIPSDVTLCDAPYDSMYIDYVLAKVALYQRDYNTYNQFMTSFNSKMDSFKRWKMSSPPHSSEKLKNWW